jgi:hypothetical protein
MKTLTFLVFNIGQSVQGRYGGTGVFIQSILEMLQQYSDEGRISLKTIELKHNPNLIKGAKLRNLLTDLLMFVNDFRKLIFNKSDILLWVYPKTPIIAFTGERHFLILARLGYNLLKISKNLSGIKIATVIEETIVELRNYLGLGVKHTSLTNILERQIFTLSDVLLTPSELMRTYIEQKHSFHNKTWINYQRDVYMKLNDGVIQKQINPRKEKVNILCSGGLMLAQENLMKIILEIKDIQTAHLYICGIGGEWIEDFISKNEIQNTEFVGILNYEEHDYLASKCDFGLIHYRPGQYHDFKTTIKYCSYAANGLAILSLRLKTIKEVIDEEELGEAVDEEIFFAKLRLWASSRHNFVKFKKNAEKVAKMYQNGHHMKIWLDELLNLV